MVVVGLTGGIATGKSTIAAMLAARGAAVVDADRIAHALQEPGQACYQRIVETFGNAILDPQGQIDRRRLGARVFADPDARRRLESILHPAIREACQREIRTAEASGHAVCVVNAALILETGQQERYDALVVVTAPREVQIARLVRNRKLTEAEAQQRLQSQWSTEAKAALADFILDHGGDLATTEAQVDRVYTALKSGTPRGQKRLDKPPGHA
jgi:dephospho-CoA kinase